MVALGVVLLIWPAFRKISIPNVLTLEMEKRLFELKKDVTSLNNKITDLSSKVGAIFTRVEILDTKIGAIQKANVYEVLKTPLGENVQPKALRKPAPTRKDLPKATPLPEGVHTTTPDISESPSKSGPQLAPRKAIEPKLKK